METNTNMIDALNAKTDAEAGLMYPKEIIDLLPTATFDDIKAVVNSDNTIGKQFNIMIAGRCVIAKRKFTWQGRVAKTSYIHIYKVNNFKDKRIIEHWRELKNGNFVRV